MNERVAEVMYKLNLLGDTGGVHKGRVIGWIAVIFGIILAYIWRGGWAAAAVFVGAIYLFILFRFPSARGITTKLIVFFLLIGLFYIFAWQTGWWDENVVGRWENRTSDGDSIFDPLTNIFNFGRLEEVGGFEDKGLVKEGIGVSVESFEPFLKDEFEQDEPIAVVAKINMGSLSEFSSEVSFMCELQGYKENGEADEVFPEKIILPAYPEKLPMQTISCSFDEGITPIGVRKDSREAKLISSFENFYSRANITVSFISQDDKNALEDEGSVVGSEYSPGPVVVPIKINYPQPFYPNSPGNPFIEVGIITDQRINLKRVGDFRLYLPEEYIELVDNNFCKFDIENSYSEGVYRVYDLKEEIYDILDKECDNEECNKGKRDIKVGCYFEIKDIMNSPVREMIKAKIWYDFNLISRTSVSIVAS
jgi:hypothetical protein